MLRHLHNRQRSSHKPSHGKTHSTKQQLKKHKKCNHPSKKFKTINGFGSTRHFSMNHLPVVTQNVAKLQPKPKTPAPKKETNTQHRLRLLMDSEQNKVWYQKLVGSTFGGAYKMRITFVYEPNASQYFPSPTTKSRDNEDAGAASFFSKITRKLNDDDQHKTNETSLNEGYGHPFVAYIDVQDADLFFDEDVGTNVSQSKFIQPGADLGGLILPNQTHATSLQRLLSPLGGHVVAMNTQRVIKNKKKHTINSSSNNFNNINGNNIPSHFFNNASTTTTENIHTIPPQISHNWLFKVYPSIITSAGSQKLNVTSSGGGLETHPISIVRNLFLPHVFYNIATNNDVLGADIGNDKNQRNNINNNMRGFSYEIRYRSLDWRVDREAAVWGNVSMLGVYPDHYEKCRNDLSQIPSLFTASDNGDLSFDILTAVDGHVRRGRVHTGDDHYTNNLHATGGSSSIDMNTSTADYTPPPTHPKQWVKKTENENGEEEWVQVGSPATLDDWYDSICVDSLDINSYLAIGSGEGFDDNGDWGGGGGGGGD